MTPEMIGLLGVVLLLLLLATKMWVGPALAISGFVGLWMLRGLPGALSVLGTVPFTNACSYSFTVIPMFMLMGLVISETDIGTGLYRTANAWVGRFRGGLASATVVACGFLGAITGSHMVGAIIMSKVALPEMKKLHYDDVLASGSVAAAAPLAIIIPPSIPMITYAIVTETSVGKLFMGGFIPGILLAVIYCVVIWLMTLRRPDYGPAGPKVSRKDRLRSIVSILPIIVLFLFVFGGLYSGWFTVTESGAFGALGAVIIAFATRQMDLRKLYRCVVQTARMAATVIVVLIGTYVFLNFITMSRLTVLLTNTILSLNLSGGLVILMIAVLYVILGMFLPDMAMIVLTCPLLYPIVTALGYDGVWFGLFVVLMAALGSITPPVGMVVYLMAGVSQVPVGKIFRGVMPFIIALLLVVLLITLFPELVLFLPNTM